MGFTVPMARAGNGAEGRRTARTSAGGESLARAVIAESWLRSSAAGVSTDGALAPVELVSGDLKSVRAEHPLTHVFPLIDDAIGQAAVDCGAVLAVGDDRGRLLWVRGSREVLRKAETIHFMEGAAWDEATAGTNAPGTALHVGAPVQVLADEHFNPLVRGWNCVAAPIRDPGTGAALGVVDLTGGADVASPQTLAMMRAVARMAESELSRLTLAGAIGDLHAPAPGPHSPGLRLVGLGRSEASASVAGREHRLSRRHSEILVALAEHPRGLTADELEASAYAQPVTSSTLRAEMNRLRAILGPDVLDSRPYRLVPEVTSDWHAVTARLAAGGVRDAARAYRGPLLLGSESPAVVRIRESLHARVRAAVLASGLPDLMVSWTRAPWGEDDVEMWERQADVLKGDSALGRFAADRAERLNRELGA